MLDRYARGFFTALFRPLVRTLARTGATPNLVTVLGSVGAAVSAVALYSWGQLFWGTVAITLFIFSDMIDGQLARYLDQQAEAGHGQARSSADRALGNFLDSSLDRLVDFAIFGTLAFWWFTGGGRPMFGTAALVLMAAGGLVSYVRAKAEALGFDASVGFVERSERLVVVLVLTGFTGLGLNSWWWFGGVVAVCVGSVVTIGQRIAKVVSQARAGHESAQTRR